MLMLWTMIFIIKIYGIYEVQNFSLIHSVPCIYRVMKQIGEIESKQSSL